MSGLNSTQLISDALFTTINKTVMIPAYIFIAVLGIVNNALTIVIFTELPATDTMTLSLTALAISDLLFSCFTLANFVISAIINSGVHTLYNVDLTSLMYVAFVWQRPLFHKISITITMFVSCERSLCVVKPFLVKHIFTRPRVIVVLVGIFCSITALFMPVYANGGLVVEKSLNGTDFLFVLYLSPGRATAEHITHLLPGFSLVVTTQLTIVTSTVFMVVGLRRHQRFRHQVTAPRHGHQAIASGDGSEELNTISPRATPFIIPNTVVSRSKFLYMVKTTTSCLNYLRPTEIHLQKVQGSFKIKMRETLHPSLQDMKRIIAPQQ